ncbi:hypothetical protein MTO96_034143 [Rhipicephalus appendiculatus]
MKNRAAIANILLLGALVVPYLPAVAGVCRVKSEFDCGNGVCVPPSFLCDDHHDCSNNADEEGFHESDIPFSRLQRRRRWLLVPGRSVPASSPSVRRE